MGAFLVNFHVRTDDPTGIDALIDSLDTGCRRSDPAGGWISVYEEQASMQDPTRIVEVASLLSERAGAPTVAFLVHDSDLAHVWLAEAGTVTCELDTWPDFPEGRPVPALEAPERLAALCSDLGTDGLRDILTRDVVFAEDVVADLAGHLGVEVGRTLVDYRDVEAEDEPGAGARGFDDLQALIEQHVPPGAESASDEEAALVEAAHAGDVTAITALLDAGTPVDALAPWLPEQARSGPAAGRTPAIAATPLLAAASNNQLEAVTLLIERGADPNADIPQGSNPLASAACAGHLEAVEALLASGADPRAIQASGITAIDAVSTARTMIAEMLEVMDAAALQGMGVELPDDAALAACIRAMEAAG